MKNYKKVIKYIGAIIVIIVIFNVSCLSPKGALRTHLFINGHPITAFISPITDDVLHNSLNTRPHTKFYTLIIAPKGKDTGSYLSNYIVYQKGFFYIAKYFGAA